jgi:hypothetical protein
MSPALFFTGFPNRAPALLRLLKVTSDEMAALVNELEKSPESFLSLLLQQIISENTERNSGFFQAGTVESSVV